MLVFVTVLVSILSHIFPYSYTLKCIPPSSYDSQLRGNSATRFCGRYLPARRGTSVQKEEKKRQKKPHNFRNPRLLSSTADQINTPNLPVPRGVLSWPTLSRGVSSYYDHSFAVGLALRRTLLPLTTDSLSRTSVHAVNLRDGLRSRRAR